MDAEKSRLPLGIVCGISALFVGLLQFLYSFLAFCSVIFVDLLGLGLTFASAAIAVVPDEPYEIPYARSLARAIAVAGMVLSSAAFFSACHSFYLRRVSWIGCGACAAACIFLAGLHFLNSLSYGGTLYVGGTVAFAGFVIGDWLIMRSGDLKALKKGC
jgi:hypothetical protein